MRTDIVDLADLDFIYLSYDEPMAEEFWAKIKNIIPWAKRVHGVEGIDAAHKAAADAADTDRFVIIDGDNIPHSDILNVQLQLNEETSNKVFRWKASNHINGLCYGNGGISCWTKEFIYSMRTHENSNGNPETAIEFCYEPNYWSMHDCYSTTYPNGSPFTAWRAGFREGVKLSMDRGIRVSSNEFTTAKKIHPMNLNYLTIWQSVGADVEHGLYAMLGARIGTYMTVLTDLDISEATNYSGLYSIYRETCPANPLDIPSKLEEVGFTLQNTLKLPIVTYSSEQSSFFKRHYMSNFKNKGAMLRE